MASGGDDPMAFVQGYDAGDLAVAAEFLNTWLPFLTSGLCPSCSDLLHRRVASLCSDGSSPPPQLPLELDRIEPTGWDSDPPSPQAAAAPPAAEKVKMSWADMAQEDELAEAEVAAEEEAQGERPRVQLTRAQREERRFRSVVSKKDFMCFERVRGKLVNILAGLELHAGVFSAAEQRRIVDCVYELQEKGKRGELGERTYTEPQKWMRGKGRVTIQFGCCYNYATDRDGNPPGILRSVVSDPLPELLKLMVKRLVRWHILPTTCVPDSCIINIYEPGDCIPPHIDSHDFVRPFCTVSFLSECDITFGSNLKIAGPGEFVGSISIPLPVGSVLVLNGNGADIAKHCVPAVPSKRISITFRKMDPSKRPFSIEDDPDLLNIVPFGTSISEPSMSSEERKGKGPEGQIRNLSKVSKDKRPNGRPSAGMVGRGILGSQYPRHDSQASTTENSSQDSLDGQSSVSNMSADTVRGSIGRLRESRYKMDTQRTGFHMDESRELRNRLAQGRRQYDGTNSIEDGAETGERRMRMEQRQIMMEQRTTEDMGSLSISSHESSNFPRVRVRTIYNNRSRRPRVGLSNE